MRKMLTGLNVPVLTSGAAMLTGKLSPAATTPRATQGTVKP
jgi:hypothetical protein